MTPGEVGWPPWPGQGTDDDGFCRKPLAVLTLDIRGERGFLLHEKD